MGIRLHAVLTTIVLSSAAFAAQVPDSGAPPAPATAPANLAYVEGGVEVTHEGVAERADPPMMLEEGDIVRTPGGRAEIVFGDGTLLHLDYNAEIEFLGPDRIRLLRGRALFRVSAAAPQHYAVDTPAASLRLAPRGEYGITADDQRGDLDITVARGFIDVDDGTSRASVRPGERMTISAPGARPVFQSFNAARFDAFERWSNDRANGFAATTSATHLPYELRPYAPVLDNYGRWDYVAPYGQVWFPSVGVAWRPYYDGSWGYTRYGWTWHGRDRWAWPTHHYGRWGFNGSFWFWIPTRVWGPAWVAWGGAPGYLCWSPLGWNGLPVIGFGPGYVGPHNPWRAWTVVPRDHFGYRSTVRQYAVDGNRFDGAFRRQWAIQPGPPAMPVGYAVPRARAIGSQVIAPAAVVPPGGALPSGIERRGNVRHPSAADPANPYEGLQRDRATRSPGTVRDPGVARDPRARESEAPYVRSAPPPSARPRDEATSGDNRQQPAQGGYVNGGSADRGGDRGNRGDGDRAAPRSQPRGGSARAGSSGESGTQSQGGSVGPARGQGQGQGQSQGTTQGAPASGGAIRRRPPL